MQIKHPFNIHYHIQRDPRELILSVFPDSFKKNVVGFRIAD